MTTRKGISSLQLSKELSVTKKTAWFMLGRLREVCRGGRTLPKRIGSPDKRTPAREIRWHVKPGRGEYVGPNDIHARSIESVWAVLKRSIHGTWHSVSAKHLDRYEAAFRLNDGNVRVHTIDRMGSFLRFAFRRRITYRKLTSN